MSDPIEAIIAYHYRAALILSGFGADRDALTGGEKHRALAAAIQALQARATQSRGTGGTDAGGAWQHCAD